MPPPFNINETSPAPSSLISAFPADEQSNRAEIEEWLSYISDPATGMIRDSVLPSADAFPTGTKMLFRQTNAPTGWTKDVTHNNKALRLVNGTVSAGGTSTFSAVFGPRTPAGTISNTVAGGTNSTTGVSGTTGSTVAGGTNSSTGVSGTTGATAAGGSVGATALTVADLPSHTHTFSATTSSNGNHNHDYNRPATTANVDGGSASASVWDNVNDTTGTSFDGAHTHTVSGTTGGTGSGSTHTHSFAGSSHDHTFNAGTHTHTFTGTGHTHSFDAGSHGHTFTGTSHGHTFTGTSMDFDLQYVDLIEATKD